MVVYALKLCNEEAGKVSGSSDEILLKHLKGINENGKTVYSTYIAVAKKPEYVLLVLGNSTDNMSYLCHVSKWSYKKDKFVPEDEDFQKFLPPEYAENANKTWLMLDSCQMIPVDFLDALMDGKLKEFINARANNKLIVVNDHCSTNDFQYITYIVSKRLEENKNT